MDSSVLKRSVVINHHKTSVSLEDAFWSSIKSIAASRRMRLSDLVAAVDSERREGNLSSALRIYALEYYRSRAPGRAGDRDLSGTDPRSPDAMQGMRA